jgi:hypothetical protein
MVLDYNGIDWSQDAIIRFAFETPQNEDPPQEKNCISEACEPPVVHSCPEIYQEKGILTESREYNLSYFEDPEPLYGHLREQIQDMKDPVHVSIARAVQQHHVVVHDAWQDDFDQTKAIAYIDPADGDRHELKGGWEIPYIVAALYVNGGPTGVNDEIQIVDEEGYNPDYVHTSDMVDFKCWWHDVAEVSHITEMIWQIGFRYNNASDLYITNEKQEDGLWIPEGEVYWNNVTLPASLPDGYWWSGTTHEGDVYVQGLFKVWVMDSDGYSHTDTKRIWFKNPGVPLIPLNVNYENETAGQDETVKRKATNSILIGDATFQSGSHGDFTSGEEIVVVPETRFEQGSEVHLKVDASLKE